MYLCAKEFKHCQSVCMIRKGWANSRDCTLDLNTLCKLFKFASAASQMLDPRKTSLACLYALWGVKTECYNLMGLYACETS